MIWLAEWQPKKSKMVLKFAEFVSYRPSQIKTFLVFIIPRTYRDHQGPIYMHICVSLYLPSQGEQWANTRNAILYSIHNSPIWNIFTAKETQPLLVIKGINEFKFNVSPHSGWSPVLSLLKSQTSLKFIVITMFLSLPGASIMLTSWVTVTAAASSGGVRFLSGAMFWSIFMVLMSSIQNMSWDGTNTLTWGLTPMWTFAVEHPHRDHDFTEKLAPPAIQHL